MAVSLSSPITGSAQTGLGSPTFTISSDSAPANNCKQWTVTALGGTQPGVQPHSISAPFTLSVWRPAIYRLLSFVTGTGVVSGKVPKNVHKLIVRKDVGLSSSARSILVATVELSVPANAETYDAASCKAAISALIGALNQVSSGWGETIVTGTL